jgi:hypothetical protein
VKTAAVHLRNGEWGTVISVCDPDIWNPGGCEIEVAMFVGYIKAVEFEQAFPGPIRRFEPFVRLQALNMVACGLWNRSQLVTSAMVPESSLAILRIPVIWVYEDRERGVRDVSVMRMEAQLIYDMVKRRTKVVDAVAGSEGYVLIRFSLESYPEGEAGVGILLAANLIAIGPHVGLDESLNLPKVGCGASKLEFAAGGHDPDFAAIPLRAMASADKPKRRGPAMAAESEKPTGWRRWFVLEIAPVIVAGYFLMAFGIGRMIQASMELKASIKEVATIQDAASIRIEDLTKRLIVWTKWLVLVTILLFVATVVLLIVTVWPRA